KVLIGCFVFFQAEDGIRDGHVTGVQTCALPISAPARAQSYGGYGSARPSQDEFVTATGRRWSRVQLNYIDVRVLAAALGARVMRSEEHTSELQSRGHLVCRLLLEKKKKKIRA